MSAFGTKRTLPHAIMSHTLSHAPHETPAAGACRRKRDRCRRGQLRRPGAATCRGARPLDQKVLQTKNRHLSVAADRCNAGRTELGRVRPTLELGRACTRPRIRNGNLWGDLRACETDRRSPASPASLSLSLTHRHASSAGFGRVASGPLRPPAIRKPRHGSAETFHFNERFDEAMTHRRGPTKRGTRRSR
jgi:hypothetical protein